MGFDLRYLIGVLFVLFGLLLALYGLVGLSADYARSLGINVNLWWGLVMLVFGALMFFAAYQKKLKR
jgi:ABC-type Fe3+-siderophore transport system permease subunit